VDLRSYPQAALTFPHIGHVELGAGYPSQDTLQPRAPEASCLRGTSFLSSVLCAPPVASPLPRPLRVGAEGIDPTSSRR
jgi:hypothetical protein